MTKRANCERGEFSQLQKWMRQRGLSAWKFKVDHLQPFKPILSTDFSNPITFYWEKSDAIWEVHYG